ncbi:SUF system NifU family Fe-S cluster assembly protein [Propionimicrobium lymphophilum]|uniref:NifU family SUF system FeS assembly protein n=1 Tax=Propionimicrobium lymphophilum ACS-093-V-SCH5 TaxID=883161 RepID=S2X098_9ACTN|nr:MULTISPECIES: SUF system NifU family Fe-S cluster assembly protein [Propionimicrobium]EPD33399.1 NifU family SUF system FeS assembly protein [Propionimicrobium lymphophilum ACS-093-V-SCH5]ETJ98262.1 SUF system FeS assembly protein, NifU family [Propionimicrobium sp. BV2F7]MDK7709780.1 SUF system NifU family Fe-S cluster assembly protein [Propionimicrobium lymphophilum]MDK7733958.1 SUF system NifU family Fe-S cluster assembly protein [Propionimicrobium lymphophilum]
MNVEQMYQEIILDHYQEKHNSGLREPFGAEVEQVNPTCGDEITLRVNLEGDKIADVSYDSEGCSISQASTSVMTDLVIGKPIEEAMSLYEYFREMMESQGEMAPDEDKLEDGIAFIGVAQFPGRVKCAMLGWSALRDAIARALSAQEKENK